MKADQHKYVGILCGQFGLAHENTKFWLIIFFCTFMGQSSGTYQVTFQEQLAMIGMGYPRLGEDWRVCKSQLGSLNKDLF